jgi:hypothetical protein
MMGKPPIEVFEQFKKKYFELSREAGLEQYIVPYLMSSHPGATMKDAVEMALWLKRWGYQPEQVQDFYPTPGTISTVMYYTGIHPMTGKAVKVTTDYHEKQLQRALLQYARPENASLVREALTLAGREDLIGNGPDCLVRAAFGQHSGGYYTDKRGKTAGKPSGKGSGKSAGRASAGHSPSQRGAASSARRPEATYHRPETAKKKTKFDRVFGEDAARIRREADALTRGGKKASGGAKNYQKKVNKKVDAKKFNKK